MGRCPAQGHQTSTNLALLVFLACSSAVVCSINTVYHDGKGASRQSQLKQGIGVPVSDWYFTIKSSKGYYCSSASDLVTCDQKYPPYSSQFALVLADGGQPPATTGQQLLLVSRTSGICTTQQQLHAPAETNAALPNQGIQSVGFSGQSHPGAGSPEAQGLLAAVGAGSGLPQRPCSSQQHREAHVEARSGRGLSSSAGSQSTGAGGDASSSNNEGAAHVFSNVFALARRMMRAVSALADSLTASAQSLALRTTAVSHSSGSAGGSAGSIATSSGSSSTAGSSTSTSSSALELGGLLHDTGVSCKMGSQLPRSFSLYLDDARSPGQAIDFDKDAMYLLEGSKFCTVAAVGAVKSALVCDLNTTAGALKFSFLRMAYPYAGLLALSSRSRCGIKSVMYPPPFDITCGPDAASDPPPPAAAALAPAAAPVRPAAVPAARRGSEAFGAYGEERNGEDAGADRQQQRRRRRRGLQLWESREQAAMQQQQAGAADGEPSRVYSFTLLTQNVGSQPTSGSLVGILTYSPGLMGLPLQQCCPQAAVPHVIECGLSTADPIPADCWYYIYKVDPDTKSGAPLNDGDLVMLASKAYARYCSTSLDGTLLCVSAQPSNASRNLFTLRMHHKVLGSGFGLQGLQLDGARGAN